MTAGPDGNLWFTEGAGEAVGHINPVTHEVGTFGIPTKAGFPENIVTGPDDELWFTESEASQIGRIVAAGGVISEFPTLTTKGRPLGITPGSDGNMWFVEEHGDQVGRIGSGTPGPLESAPTVSGGGRVGTPQLCNVSWSPWARQLPSASLFGFDGYSWLLDGSPIAAGQTYTPTAAQVGHQLSCAETVTYPLLTVSSSATSAAVLVNQPPAAAAPPAALGAPTVTLKQSATKWQVSRKDPSECQAQVLYSYGHRRSAQVRRTPCDEQGRLPRAHLQRRQACARALHARRHRHQLRRRPVGLEVAELRGGQVAKRRP
jgi:hypothetical protein